MFRLNTALGIVILSGQVLIHKDRSPRARLALANEKVLDVERSEPVVCVGQGPKEGGGHRMWWEEEVVGVIRDGEAGTYDEEAATWVDAIYFRTLTHGKSDTFGYFVIHLLRPINALPLLCFPGSSVS